MLDFNWYRGNLDWMKHSTIFLARSGSHAYGTNLETSDEDYRGVCIPPKRYFHGFKDQFEQVVVNEPYDVTIFDIRKFFKLTADANPNMLEMLFVDESDWFIATRAWRTIHDQRQRFVTKKAMHTFSGYAMSQLKRIKSHRAWLLNPPTKHPERKDYDLPDAPTLEKEQFGVIEARLKKTEDVLGGEGFTKDKVADVDPEMVAKVVTDLNLSPNLIEVIVNERRYNAAMRNWAQYQQWKEGRNATRSELEAKFGYDTKHAMHLVRLMRMAIEILSTGQVIVKRPDAQDLLAIRAGAWTFDDLMAWAQRMEKLLEGVYATSQLPHSADYNRLSGLCASVVESHLGYPYLGPG